MISSIQVGKVIYQLLQANSKITKIVGKKIYPLIADYTTTFPFIIYRRSGLYPQSNKDYIDESVNVEIYIATETYKEGIELAEITRKSLEHKEGVFSEIDITDITLQDASEEFIDNTFIQNLKFKIDIDNGK